MDVVGRYRILPLLSILPLLGKDLQMTNTDPVAWSEEQAPPPQPRCLAGPFLNAGQTQTFI